ncbi:MAG: hypothetical protein WBI29_02155, partial [Candidatus Saccharimonadales bacterium]
LKRLLLCDIQLPFGRHHIHRYLFAPRRHKFDGYWHVILLLVLCTASRASTFINISFGARHIDDSIK